MDIRLVWVEGEVEEAMRFRGLITQGTRAVDDAQGRLFIIWAKTVNEAITRLQEISCDIIVFDVEAKDSEGLSGLKALIKEARHIPVIAYAKKYNSSLVLEALRSGACDFILRDEAPEFIVQQIFSAIRCHGRLLRVTEIEESLVIGDF